MDVDVFNIPYDSGHRAFRTGQGPGYLLGPLVERLEEQGHVVTSAALEASTFPTTEVATMFELYRELALRVGTSVGGGRFPLVLSGNCNCIVGTLGGLGDAPVAHLFFDGHGDFNTPETTTTGFLDGMGLAMATGRCWNALTSSIPGFRPLPEALAALVGARDIDELEQRAIETSDVTWVSSSSVRELGVSSAMTATLERMRSRAEQIYLHFDMDVLDPEVAPANRLSPPDGLSLEELIAIVQLAKQRFTVAAASFASIEPACDDGGKTLRASLDVVDALLAQS